MPPFCHRYAIVCDLKHREAIDRLYRCVLTLRHSLQFELASHISSLMWCVIQYLYKIVSGCRWLHHIKLDTNLYFIWQVMFLCRIKNMDPKKVSFVYNFDPTAVMGALGHWNLEPKRIELRLHLANLLSCYARFEDVDICVSTKVQNRKGSFHFLWFCVSLSWCLPDSGHWQETA